VLVEEPTPVAAAPLTLWQGVEACCPVLAEGLELARAAATAKLRAISANTNF